MKKLRRSLILLALVCFAVSLVLLLNFTAPNPTGRRYSSESPITTGQGSAQQIGVSAERILARDLGIPRNEDPDQRQCFCNSGQPAPPLSECRVCMAYAQLSTSTYRRPDFVAPGFIAESKNRQNLLYTYEDQVEQLGDYVLGARALGRPLWLYTRVNTQLSPEFYRLVESTGGGIVPYFTVPGYVDPVDRAATIGLLTSGVALAVLILWGQLEYRWTRQDRPPRRPRNRVDGAARAVSNAEAFMRQTEERERFKGDVEDSRLDM